MAKCPDSPTTHGLNHPNADRLSWFRKCFRPHFKEWVFGPTDRLVASQDALIGFILMACAIDYLAGFWWGKKTTNSVRAAYTGFVDAYFPKGRYDAQGLYDSLRNGLVHMFTIKNKKYALTHNRGDMHLKSDSAGQIILNAADFRDDLVKARDRYFDQVEITPDLLDNLWERYSRDGFLAAGPIQVANTGDRR
jgi:hypothetical protein